MLANQEGATPMLNIALITCKLVLIVFQNQGYTELHIECWRI